MKNAARFLALLILIAGGIAPIVAEAKSAPQKPPQTAAAPADEKSVARSAAPAHYRDLAPADRKVAHALFEAQRPTADGPAPLNLDQIAALKARNGWEPAFKSMKAQGLLPAKTLRQVIGAPARDSRALPALRAEGFAMSDAEGRALK